MHDVTAAFPLVAHAGGRIPTTEARAWAGLKLAQRERVLALGLDLIEWTYDPLQALNANLNFVTLGVVVEEYEENIYGESASPLHGGLPTDRFVCQWWIRRAARGTADRRGPMARQVDRVDEIGRAHEVAARLSSTRPRLTAHGSSAARADLTRTEPRLAVDIPIDFTGMLAARPGSRSTLALPRRARSSRTTSTPATASSTSRSTASTIAAGIC